MKELTITTLAQIVGAKIPDVSPCASRVAGVSIDSRTVKPGDCFFAIAGENFDGHDYVAEALTKGAVCAVVAKHVDAPGLAGKCLLTVDDTVRALGDFARRFRRDAAFKVVAITGSAGKTTTRQIIHHVLSRRFRVSQSPKSFNNNIGLPLTLLAADPNDDAVLTELGSNHPGEIAYLTRIALPDIAVITNVYPAHIEGFGDLAAILREKSSIAEGLRPGGEIIVNGDFPELSDAFRDTAFSLSTFGTSAGCDCRAEDIRSDGRTSRFTIDGVPVRLPLPGAGNVQNALAAWAVCTRFGVAASQFADAVRDIRPASMRTEILQTGVITILNDCYNANPASMENALGILAALAAQQKHRPVFICGDMAELGADSERLHAALGRKIAKAGVRLLLAVGASARIVSHHARETAGHDLNFECFENTPQACNNLHKFIKDYDIVLVKGSRTAKLETAVDKLRELFPGTTDTGRAACKEPMNTR